MEKFTRLFYIRDGILFNSDFHILHPNILIYEYESRKGYVDGKTKEEIESIAGEKTSKAYMDLIRESSYQFLHDLNTELEEILKEEQIHTYYNLGDFIFNITPTKIETFLGEEGENKVRDELYRFFDILRSHDIERHLILGNHDVTKDKQPYTYYYKFFNHISAYELIGEKKDILLAHYPLTREHPKLRKEERELREKIEGVEITESIFGHIHSFVLPEHYKEQNIRYVNVCTDYLFLYSEVENLLLEEKA